MLNILFVHTSFPEFDRSSGDLRLSAILKIAAKKHRVTFLILYKPAAFIHLLDNRRYFEYLKDLGVEVRTGSLSGALEKQHYDAVFIERYYVARPLIKDIRILQPEARIIVDTEHVNFYSNQLKAELFAQSASSRGFLADKRQEVNVYEQADLVLAVTEEDKNILLAENANLSIDVIPNIYDEPRLKRRDPSRAKNSLLFIGNFSGNEPNIDAMKYFCKDIFPLISRRVPDCLLQIVGNQPTQEILGLAKDNTLVTGYVPETAPYLLSSRVSVCPLRYGAGLKGKVVEAMAYGLPVVSSSVGVQGMNLKHGEHVMIADTPEQFANCVEELLTNESLWVRLSNSGRNVARQYSPDAVEELISASISKLQLIRVIRYHCLKRWMLRGVHAFNSCLDDFLSWRFPKRST